MKESDKIISIFNKELSSRIKEAEDNYEKVRRNRKGFEQMIIGNKDKTISNPILTAIFNHINNGTEYDWLALNKLLVGGVQPANILIPSIIICTNQLIISYINIFF